MVDTSYGIYIFIIYNLKIIHPKIALNIPRNIYL